jgi:hypothetical protein
VAKLADFMRFSKALELRSVSEQYGHWSSELVSQCNRRVAAELPTALNVYGAFTLSRQMFMAALTTIPHRTDSSGVVNLPLGVVGVYMAGESSRPIAGGGRPSDIERRRCE